VLLQCCECDTILTSSTPSQSFNKHFSWDGPSILRCELLKGSSKQLTWLRLATINFWALASQSFPKGNASSLNAHYQLF
jgi:hypothetical protein